MDKKLRVEEVAILVGISIQTLNYWYRWKTLNPNHELAKYLPEYIQEGMRKTRYWKSSDVWGIVTFKNLIPHGRNGILAEVTQRKVRKHEKN